MAEGMRVILNALLGTEHSVATTQEVEHEALLVEHLEIARLTEKPHVLRLCLPAPQEIFDLADLLHETELESARALREMLRLMR